jgi:hypothetical protein
MDFRPGGQAPFVAAGRLNRAIVLNATVWTTNMPCRGLLHRTVTLARGAFMAATIEYCPVAAAEHVRAALTEIL